MDAQTWSAIVAAVAVVGGTLIALRALAYNSRAVSAADRAARAAEDQTKIQQQLRIEAAQPYAWVDIRADEAVGTLLNLVIGNSGPTLARNVRVRVNPPLPTIDQLRDRVDAAQARLADGISSLPPGRVITWPLGQGFNLLAADGPQAHTFTVATDGPFGPVPPLTYVVDLADLRGSLDRPIGSLHQLTKAVEDLGKKLDGHTASWDTVPPPARGETDSIEPKELAESARISGAASPSLTSSHTGLVLTADTRGGSGHTEARNLTASGLRASACGAGRVSGRVERKHPAGQERRLEDLNPGRA